MSSFVPHPLNNGPPLLEEPSHPDRTHDPKKNLVIAVNNPLDDTLPALGEEASHPEDSQDPEERHLRGVQQVVVTAIHATDLTLGLQRIPAGFHVVVKADDDIECQTSNKPVYIDQTVVEWNDRILLVYASFELDPMLGHGEVLRTFNISVGELLDRSEKSRPIIFQPKQEEVVSSCTSLFMTVEQRCSYENNAAGLLPLTILTPDNMRELALWTDGGHCLLAQYRWMQKIRDLDQSITHFERASDLCPMNHPCRPAALFNLAVAKFVSCQVNGTYLDLDIPISLFQYAFDLRPTGHPDRPITQLHLAIALLSRFAKRGFETDADAAKELLRKVLNVCHANSHISRAALLAIETCALHRAKGMDGHDLGQMQPATSMLPLSPQQFTDRAERCLHGDDPHDLDEVISLHYDALRYYGTMHDCRGPLISNLGEIVLTRFERRGNEQDLDDAIMLHRDALALRPVGHPNRSMSLNNIANALFTRFKHRGNDQDLDDAIMLHRDALALCLVGHPNRSMDVLALHPVGHPDRSMSLNNLANALSTRFMYRGNEQDLDDGFMLHRDALALHPVGHPNRSSSLINLATALSIRFEHRGNEQDLDDAIMLHRDALALCPVGHPDRSISLNDLADALFTRFECRGNDQDLDDTIMLSRDALALYPVGHPDRSTPLNNLANALSTRFKHRSNEQDLDDAIMLSRDALALRPVGHPNRSSSLNDLVNVLFTHFEHRSNDQDLDDAIMLHRDALALRPVVDHPNRSSSLHNLAIVLSDRFEHRSNGEDLRESLENLRCALTLLTQHDPRQSNVHRTLATVYLLFHQSGLDSTGEDTDSLNVAIHHLKAAANIVSGGLRHRLQTSLRWVRDADQYSHDTELEAYVTSMQLLDAYMSATASVSSRHNTMMDFPRTLAADAASCALRSGDVCRAIELLEQGRTLIWTQMTRLRTPLDGLQDLGDHAVALMKKFRYLSSLLDTPPTNDPEGTPRVNVEAEASRYRRLVEDWNRAVEEIRMIEGFSRFLLPPLFSDLQDAARDGPIVVLVASKSSCDAIIVPHKQPPISIKLHISLEKLQHLVVKLQRASQPQASSALMKALTELWDDVVCPVVDNLGGFAPPFSRIWWCPTGAFNFLPLHAAGAYRRGLQGNQGQTSVAGGDGSIYPGPTTTCSSDYLRARTPATAPGPPALPRRTCARSHRSNTPSLTTLIRARRSRDRSLPVPFAAIGQDHPAGHPFTLDCVEPELELVRSLLPAPSTVSFTKITSVDATKLRVLRALRDNTWLHLSCHGTQNYTEPFNSAFLMRDQPISLLDISQMDLSRHEFTFLSACETAVGDANTPDEVIHLAASLQFAGVQSVVGTLWSVNDSTVQRLVEAFYKNLCGDGKMNSKRAARALHRAVQSLAGDQEMPLDQRIVFMHIGI
ncbi:CHAT domain-containing protein [Suillus clintonianus]|uniref:CHAT domain-containing protein n=1 Tax=Suillus clintonianus TaxID=1904413 RepID=UPI001B867ACF|nr:CHAT domain-containing protein [Suillus clintonianus]KAG2111019.1 CHAT domain-containing protein [Suillus clintonianus]